MGRQRVSVNYRRVIYQVYSVERQLADCKFGVLIQEDDLLKTIGISRVDFDTFQWICKSWGDEILKHLFLRNDKSFEVK